MCETLLSVLAQAPYRPLDREFQIGLRWPG